MSTVDTASEQRSGDLPMPPGLSDVRVRFAPNGEIAYAAFFTRTILYSWLFARRYSGAFILRFDDTDLDRQIPGALQSYPRGMRWLGLDWDEGPEVGGDYGPYSQSGRLDLYRDAIERLLAEGKAYQCYCDRERLAELSARSRQGRARAYDGRCRDLTAARRRAARAAGIVPAVRLRVPDTGMIRSADLLRGEVGTPADELSDFVICRPDGWPTYHLTVVVDDSLMRISHVIRGSEGLANIAPQAVVHKALGLPEPLYLHFPLVRIEDFRLGDRFLPSGQALYIDDLRAAGWFPEAIVNYYAHLGYGYRGRTEIQSRDELVDAFDYRRISRKAVVEQSTQKLGWVNRQYLQRHASRVDTVAVCTDAVVRAGLASPAQARPVVERSLDVIRVRMACADDAAALLGFAFTPPDGPALPGGLTGVQTAALRTALLDCAAAVADGTGLGPVLARAAERHGLDRGEAIRPVVGILAGGPSRLSPDDLAAVLGVEETRARLLRALREVTAAP
ncbi:glutamate--tRNA ligase [Actinomadura latina]|uniref:Glutamate--tRNA ligase n=1 Tax=Actinomadura latina TaxID=163603 RepID=A0A846YZ97_9ACTN|nr:glutamate--tRNA ligase [Actinomadura latina]NKZ03433.1 glutamate--tRNA ligase [Actinomadura latina]